MGQRQALEEGKRHALARLPDGWHVWWVYTTGAGIMWMARPPSSPGPVVDDTTTEGLVAEARKWLAEQEAT